MMSGESLLETPLTSWHRAHGGRLVEFGGWSMPVQYTTIIEEHQAVRQRVGLFDISHMGRLAFGGPDALGWLEQVTTNHVARLKEGQTQYSLMAKEQGGVIDDVLVYRLPASYNMVCNAANRNSVLAQLERFRPAAQGTVLTDCTRDTAMIAVQGPQALATLQPLVDAPLEPLAYYHATLARVLGTVDALVSRTGYTGEEASRWWSRPIRACGPGRPCSSRDGRGGSFPAASAPGTRSASRRRCRFTATS
jgi:aminomethyltransferase